MGKVLQPPEEADVADSAAVNEVEPVAKRSHVEHRALVIVMYSARQLNAST